MKTYIMLCGAAGAMLLSAFSSLSAAAQRQTLLDDDWRFRISVDDKGARLDNDWIRVDLPHDWSVLSDFMPDAAMGTEGGYLPAGTGEYVKNIVVSDPSDGRRLLYLEGAYMNSRVKVNGNVAGGRPYGYSSYFVDITPFLQEGDNSIEISVDNSQQKNSRWYPGSGLYRHVWLYHLPSVAVEPWGLFVTTPQVSKSSASVNLDVDLGNNSDATRDVEVHAFVKDAGGKVKAKTGALATVDPGLNRRLSLDMDIIRPELWSAENPYLYSAVVEILMDGKTVDKVEQPFGIRKIEYSAEEGLKVNGNSVVLNGGCVHHDHGILGARSYDAAEARRVRLLKEAGFNAVRTSHNHPSPAFLRECDRQGLYVIDESFDCWRQGKNPHDYAEHIDRWWKEDIASLVKRDRNHPSVICWSTGNEVLERKSLDAVMTARHLAAECRRLDPTRPVTSALAAWDSDWELYDPLAEAHDIVGYNYMIHKAEEDHARDPHRVMWQTESYPRDAFRNWEKVNDLPYVIGDFVWTAVDYLGESGIGRNYYEGETAGEHWQAGMWPVHGATCGDIDLMGQRRPISHYRDILYNPDRKLYMAVREPNGYKGEIKKTLWSADPVFESWNWPGYEGKIIEVEVISRYPKVRLYQDGVLVGEKSTGRKEAFMAVFPIEYRPGVIEARGVDADGRESEPVKIETAGAPYALRLTADRASLAADNQDLSFLDVEVVDRKGRVVPVATDRITISVGGQGSLEAAGSADMKDTASYSRNVHNASQGRAGAVVKSTHSPGKIIVRASAPGLKPASLTIKTK